MQPRSETYPVSYGLGGKMARQEDGQAEHEAESENQEETSSKAGHTD